MSSRESNSTSSKRSGSSRSQQQQQDMINAGFDRETKSKIANNNSTKQNNNPSPPSLVKDHDGDDGKEQSPLLYLHQSTVVSGSFGNNKNGNKNDDGVIISHHETGEHNSRKQREQKPDVAKPSNSEQKLFKLKQNSEQQPTKSSSEKVVTSSSSKVVVDSQSTKPKTKSTDTKTKGGDPNENLSSPSSVLFKIISISTLLLLWLSLMNSVIVNNNSISSALPKILLDVSSKMTTLQLGIISLVPNNVLGYNMYKSSSSLSMIQMEEQFEKRLELGLTLLRKYDDASGSVAACESAFHYLIQSMDGTSTTTTARGATEESYSLRDTTTDGRRDYLTSRVLLAGRNHNDGGRLLSKALLCMGEARLALSSSLLGSQDMREMELMKAKESLEAATAINPTDPSVRSSLGLTYLLLGLMKKDDDNDDNNSSSSIQFLFQSIQHLKAAVGLTSTPPKSLPTNDVDDEESSDTKSEDDDTININIATANIRNAAVHNLGLAYMALDGVETSSGSSSSSSYFSDWVTLLTTRSQSSSSPQEATTTSWVFLANEGVMKLLSSQMGNNNIDDAISSLEHAASSCETGRRCGMVRHNLAIAKRSVLYGEQQEEETSRIDRISGGTTIYNEVAQWNARVANENASTVSSSTAAVVTAEIESREEDDVNNANTTVPSDDDDEVTNATTSDVSEGKNETSTVAVASDDGNEMEDDDSPSSSLAETEESKTESKNAVTPEMQNALAALEKASEAAEGTQRRTRLLLALARARHSSGDLQGAIDASLKAISAALSDEEAEASTSYLEMLMEKIAAGGEEETTVRTVISEEEEHQLSSLENPSPEDKKTSTTTALVENKDFALHELTLKLELERLKYKVLEQEMMLQGMYKNNNVQHQQQRQYNPDNMRAIDYRQEVQDHHDDNIIPQRRHNLDVIEEQKIIASKTTMKKEPILEHETTTVDVVIQDDDNNVRENKDPAVMVATGNEIDNNNDDDANNGKESTMNDDVLLLPDDESSPQNDTLSEESLPNEVTTTTTTTENADADADNESLHREEDAVTANNTTDLDEVEEDPPPVETPIELPNLFAPTLKPPPAVPPTAKSYMKMADAYLDKGKYALAAKQFLKVIKKAPDHLPAHLGYATALERAGKPKQITAVALAYGNATKVAIIQGDTIDPMAKSGAGGIAENILRRAVQLAKSAPNSSGSGGSSSRLETLQLLSAYAHTAALAADMSYEIGMEIVPTTNQGGSSSTILQEDEERKEDILLAKQAFMIANEFTAMRNDTENPHHIGSIIELGKIALEYEDNAVRVIDLFNKVKNVHMEDAVHVELLVLVGRAHASLGELETAITEFTRALSFPQSSSTPSAHNELALTLKKNNGDTHEINLHFEKALDMGMDPTSEAMEALGERNMAVMRALNRQYYQSFNSGGSSADKKGSGGGIMSGGGVGSQSTSVFAPKSKQSEEQSSPAQSDTLNLLEQGAAAYDGHTPMGGEVEGTESTLSNVKVKKQHQGSESNLSNLRR